MHSRARKDAAWGRGRREQDRTPSAAGFLCPPQLLALPYQLPHTQDEVELLSAAIVNLHQLHLQPAARSLQPAVCGGTVCGGSGGGVVVKMQCK